MVMRFVEDVLKDLDVEDVMMRDYKANNSWEARGEVDILAIL